MGARRASWPDDHDTVAVTAVVTDSREAGPGALYLARRGEQLDGADFAPAAVEAGAVATVATRPLDVPTLVVDDVQAALVAIARAVRGRAVATVVGITGSVGKTTTKDLLATVAGATVPTVAARGSYNNEVGVPLTVCRTDADTAVLVAELGARGRGHIAELATWLRPDVAVVTIVAGAHLELFGSLDEVAVAKAELVASLGPDGVAVLNVDDHRVAAMAHDAPGRVVRVSVDDAAADVHARDVRLDGASRASFTAVLPGGRSAPVALPITGRHHVLNALLALAAADAVGVDPVAGAAALSRATVSGGRGRVLATADGGILVDDSYNANPTSVLAALGALADLQVTGRRHAVLGVMAEIGPTHEADHRRVGAAAAEVVDALVVVGAAAAGLAAGARAARPDLAVSVVDDAEAAVAALGAVPHGDAVLVKGSRVAGLERLVDLVAGPPHPDDPPSGEAPR
nr:UDP-N-acetylmuramoyl-tripeptide--D-alanyl-D-alanine ligase [Salsipaludibacter albus]